jgi:hypothetical protein
LNVFSLALSFSLLVSIYKCQFMELSFSATHARFVQRQRVYQSIQFNLFHPWIIIHDMGQVKMSYETLEVINIILHSVQLKALHSLFVVDGESGDCRTLWLVKCGMLGASHLYNTVMFCHVSLPALPLSPHANMYVLQLH